MMCNVICDLNTKWKICAIWIEPINQSMFITPATTHRIFQASKAKNRGKKHWKGKECWILVQTV